MGYPRPTPRNESERRVQVAGYPYMDTVTLSPNQPIGLHVHQSENTHLIINGSLTFFAENGKIIGYLDANSSALNDKEFRVSPGMRYQAKAGPNGARFVEAHSILSPTTAERFMDRRVIGWVDEGWGEDRNQWHMEHRKARMSEASNGRLTRPARLRGLYWR